MQLVGMGKRVTGTQKKTKKLLGARSFGHNHIYGHENVVERSVNGGNVLVDVMSGANSRDMLRHSRRWGFAGRVDSGAIEGRVRTVRKRALKGQPEHILSLSIILRDFRLRLDSPKHASSPSLSTSHPFPTRS